MISIFDRNVHRYVSLNKTKVTYILVPNELKNAKFVSAQ